METRAVQNGDRLLCIYLVTLEYLSASGKVSVHTNLGIRIVGVGISSKVPWGDIL